MNKVSTFASPTPLDQCDVLRDAYAVLLPAFESAEFNEEARSFFSNGGVASLLGSTREEYVARRMSPSRRLRETPETFLRYRRRANEIAGNVLVAIDYEIGGVHRLHNLGPQLEHPSSALTMQPREIWDFGQQAGEAAKKLGINFFLSPVLDVVTGANPWLLDRTLSTNPEVVALICSAFIKGVQSSGVLATGKHFPGHHVAVEDPYDSASVTVSGTLDDLATGFLPFRSAISAGVKAIMTGPIPVDAIDRDQPSSTSAKTVAMLRNQFRFEGLVVSDDIDLQGTMRGRSLEEVAVASLSAGVELLLLAVGPELDVVARYIAAQVAAGRLDVRLLRAAAQKVRQLAKEAA